VYDEYVWINATQTFELIGSTKVDLTDYAKKEYVDNAIAEFESFPDQTGNAGKFLQTNGAEVSWAKALENNSTASRAIATGLNATATQGGTAIGADSQAGSYAVAVGDLAKATGKRSVQLGKGTNADAGTLKFGNDSGNYTVLDVNGIVPAERISSTAGTTGQVLTKTDTGMEWQEAPASGTKVIIKRYN
jgi:hypothetical protein